MVTGVCVGVGTILFFLSSPQTDLCLRYWGACRRRDDYGAVGDREWLFHETLTFERALGIALSIAGILLLKRSSQ